MLSRSQEYIEILQTIYPAVNEINFKGWFGGTPPISSLIAGITYVKEQGYSEIFYACTLSFSPEFISQMEHEHNIRIYDLKQCLDEALKQSNYTVYDQLNKGWNY